MAIGLFIKIGVVRVLFYILSSSYKHAFKNLFVVEKCKIKTP